MATAMLDIDMPVVDQPASTDIVALVSAEPGIVLLDPVKFDVFYDRMKAETDKLVPDTSTQAGRDEIRSVSARVVRSKTSIDKARLGLTAGWRDLTSKANAAGKVIEERLAALAAEVRKPLTDWEAAEAARIATCRGIIDRIKADRVIAEDDTAATVRERGTKVHETVFDVALFGDMLDEADAAKRETVGTLIRALSRLTQEEADRAELERLRAERAESDRVAAESEAAAQAQRDRVEAERIAEERRITAEREDAERIRAAEEAAANAARDAEAERAASEQAERDREHAAELAAAQARADEAERLRQEEAERVAAVERQREADAKAAREEADRVAAEDARRAKNRAHVAAVMGEAKQAIMTFGVDEPVAKAIVLAVKAGAIPHVGIAF